MMMMRVAEYYEERYVMMTLMTSSVLFDLWQGVRFAFINSNFAFRYTVRIETAVIDVDDFITLAQTTTVGNSVYSVARSLNDRSNHERRPPGVSP